jgi:hypothetical protein
MRTELEGPRQEAVAGDGADTRKPSRLSAVRGASVAATALTAVGGAIVLATCAAPWRLGWGLLVGALLVAQGCVLRAAFRRGGRRLEE